MKKIGLIVKEISENRIKDNLKENKSFVLIKYSGLSGPDVNALRLALKAANTSLFVVKNSVARRAFKAIGLDPVIKSIDGPCGLIFIKEEPVSVSKALCDFNKTHEALKLEIGYLQDRILEKKDIEDIAKLPSKDVLRAQVVMTLNSPIARLVRTLNQSIVKFVVCLDQIKQKKSAS